MNLTFKLLPDGGFVAGDRDSEITAYAYPTSEYAFRAKRMPHKTALAMLNDELPSCHESESGREYDRRNWLLISGAAEQLPPEHPGCPLSA